MKNKLFIILFIIFCFSITVHAENTNIIKNGDFEGTTNSTASNWSSYVWDEKSVQFEITSDEAFKHSGEKSMRLKAFSPTDIRLKQEIDVSPNSLYKLTAWVKTQDIGSDNKGANLSADGIVFTSVDLKGTNDWKQLELYGKTGKNQKKLTVTVGLGGYGSLNSGTMWVDDLSVEAVKSLPAGASSVNLSTPETSNSSTPSNTQSKNHVSAIVAFSVMLISLAIAYFGGKSIMSAPVAKKYVKELSTVSEKLSIDKKDLKVMFIITAIYLVIALFNLGSLNIPQTGYSPKSLSDSITVDFGKKVSLNRIYYYGGLGDGSFNVEAMDDKGNFNQIIKIEKKDIFSFKYVTVSANTSKIRITPNSTDFTLNELYFTETGKTEPLEIKNADTNTADARKLFDEQKTFAYKPSYLTNMYFDEIYHARTAFEHIHNLEPYEWTHPPLGKIFMAVGILVFGMNPFGFRIIGTLFGAAMLPLMYLFGKKIFKDWRFAAMTSLLMMFDFMHFTQTRIATIDVYGTFFIIAMYYYMYDTFMIKSYDIPFRLSLKPLFLSGLMFGLGVASKWIAAYGGAGLAIVFFTAKYLEYRDYKKVSENTRAKDPSWRSGFISKNMVITLSLCVLFFIVIPAAIYYFSYIPFMEVPGAKKSLELVIDYQKRMFDYHSKLKATHSFSSPWYEWPIIYKPTWFYSGSDVAPGNASTIVTMGNPAIWWVGIAAFFTSIYIALKKKDKKMLVIFAAIVFQYMPWVLVPRITWIYHFFSTVPFMIICIVYVLKEMYDRNRIKGKTIITYLGICALLFVLFYPALSGLEVPKIYINCLRWFTSWIF